MPTVDIKTNYSAVGDGQRVSATVTINSSVLGTNRTLIVTGGSFVSGDVGKIIQVRQPFAGLSTPTQDLPFNTTIASRVSATTVTLSASGTALSGVTRLVEWATNDTAHFAAFKTAQAGATGVILTIPAGRYCVLGPGYTQGILGLEIVGTGNPVISNMMDADQGSNYGCGNTLVGGDLGVGSSLVETVSAGSNYLTVATPGIFSANTWALMTGMNVQGTGDPPNFRWDEYVYITDITGDVLTLERPLQYSYNSTWPQWSTTPQNRAGPATLYVLDPDWDCDHSYTGFTIEEWWGGPKINGRAVTLDTCDIPAFPVTPSENRDLNLTDCTSTAFTVEVDKLIENVTVTGGSWKAFACQSPSPKRFVLTGVTIGNLACSAHTVIDGCTIGTSLSDSLTMVPSQSGYSDGVVVQNSTLNCSVGLGEANENNVFGAGPAQWTLTGDTFSAASSEHEITNWAVPGAVCFLGGSFASMFYPFRVLGTYESGGTIYVTTTLNGLPTIPNSGTYGVKTHPCPSVTFRDNAGLCDVAEGWDGAVRGAPSFSYWNKTYTTISSAPTQGISIFGRLTRCVFNVTDAFSSGTLNWGTYVSVMRMSDGSSQNWGPQVDLTTVGERIITESGVTGSAGSDSDLAFVAGGMWVTQGSQTMYPTSSPAATAGSITITMETDQGISIEATMHIKRAFGITADVADPSDDYYAVTAALNPAISTNDYYHSVGEWGFRPYDLAQMGAAGAAVMAVRGYRYFWGFTGEHPQATTLWRNSSDTWIAFSNDPGTLPDPSTMISIFPGQNVWFIPEPSILTTAPPAYSSGAHYSRFAYNPTDPDGLPFYFYNEAGAIHNLESIGHTTGIHRSANLIDWTPWGIGFLTAHVEGQWSSFSQVRRHGEGDWTALSLVGAGYGYFLATCIWTSTDGLTWTPTGAPADYRLYNGQGPHNTGTMNFTYNGTTKVLTSSTALFTAADLNAKIQVGGQRTISSAPSGPGYTVDSSWGSFQGRITTVTDSTHVTITPDTFQGFSGDTTISTPSGIFVEWVHDVNAFPYLGGSHDQQFWFHTPDIIEMGAQTYQVCKEANRAARPDPTNYASLLPIDEDLGPTGATTDVIRLSPIGEYDDSFIGQDYGHEVNSYTEDGILHIYYVLGWSSETNWPGEQPGGPWPYGSLKQQNVDYYTYVFNVAQAANAAPVGVQASCASGTVTLTWYDALPHTNYRVYRGNVDEDPANITTLVGDVDGVTTTNSPASGRWWYKVVTMNGVEQGSRVVSVYVSALTALCNKHLLRVYDATGSVSTVDTTYLAAVDAWLTSNSLSLHLLQWADIRLGYATSGGHITKIFDLGSTYLPRSNDLSTHTSSTTYSATAVSSTLPGWVNANTNSYLYWGKNDFDPNFARFNQIRYKTQITVAALYKRTDTSVAITPIGTSASYSTLLEGSGGESLPKAVPNFIGLDVGMYLSHSAGTPGTITFALRDTTGTAVGSVTSVLNTATVAGAGTADQVAVGVFNGTNMYAYSNSTAGSPNANYDPNLDLGNDTVLAGTRHKSSAQVGPYPFMGSGYKSASMDLGDGHYDGSGVGTGYYPLDGSDRAFGEMEAKFNGGALVVLGKGLSSGEVTSLVALLTTEAAPAPSDGTAALLPMGCM